jgi:hypothetical protein
MVSLRRGERQRVEKGGKEDKVQVRNWPYAEMLACNHQGAGMKLTKGAVLFSRHPNILPTPLAAEWIITRR